MQSVFHCRLRYFGEMSWREDVRRVDWGAFEGAYGAASDLPSELDRLCSPEADHGSVSFMHQGDVYEVTPHVVPYLISIAEDEDVPITSRLEVMQILVAMAEREPPSNPGARFNPFTKQAEPRPSAPFAALVKSIHATHAALRREEHRVVALTKHANEALCALAKELRSQLAQLTS